jgi:hypothetical protein
MFVAKLTPAGAHLWSRSFGGMPTSPGATGLAMKPNGEAILVGNFTGTIVLGDAQLSAAGDTNHYDIFVSRLSGSTGQPIASMRLGGTGQEIVGSVAPGPSGEIILTGQFAGFSEFGTDTLTSVGTSDGFLLVSAPP